MENNGIKKVVATGIGAALFVIIGMLVNIPTPIPNTSIQLQYAVIALLAIVYGPSVGFLSGFIGHALKDAVQYGSPWWTWVLVSGLVGLVIGLLSKKLNIEKGYLTFKEYLLFNGAQISINVLGWGYLAPWADITFYNEPSAKVYLQGLWSAGVNAATIGIGGTILLAVYAANRVKSGSLSKD